MVVQWSLGPDMPGAFTVIQGYSLFPFACTWCAQRFSSRAELEKHWIDSPRCERNKEASNPLQTKYGEADIVVAQPGELTLHLVRASSCLHVDTKPLVDAGGQVIAWQCMYCYEQLPPNDD